MGIEDRIRQLDDAARTRQNYLDQQHAAQVQDRAVIANQMLRHYSNEVLSVLRRRNNGRLLEVSFSTIIPVGRPSASNVRVIPGRVVWRISPRPPSLGILESGELVAPSRYHRPVVRGKVLPKVAERKVLEKAQAVAQRSGCIDWITSIQPIDALGEPPN